MRDNDTLILSNLAKTRNLQKLVDKLNNTTTGSLQNQISAIASILGITFNADGTLDTHIPHTHSYEDNDGTTTETKTTGGISQ